jgi:hypothetical protein
MQDDICVIFAPGTAGNHLANILSIDSRFNARTTPQFYDHLVQNAHPPRPYIKLNQRPSVLAMHLAQCVWYYDTLSDATRFVVIEFPPETRTPRFMARVHGLYQYYHLQCIVCPQCQDCLGQPI